MDSASDQAKDCHVGVYQGGRQILSSGVSIVTPGSPPLVVSVGGDVRLIHFDMVPEFRRRDGAVVGGRHDAHSIGPDESKTAPVGDAFVTYTLENYRPDRTTLDAAGRPIPASCVLIWEVWREAPGMMVPAAIAPDLGMRVRDPSCLV